MPPSPSSVLGPRSHCRGSEGCVAVYPPAPEPRVRRADDDMPTEIKKGGIQLSIGVPPSLLASTYIHQCDEYMC